MERILVKLDRLYLGELKENSIFPEKKNIFKAFKLCPREDVKVVIIGQDPYKDYRATGLAFANPANTPEKQISPSLQIIIDALERSYPGESLFFDVTLESWAKQGVLLLNSALTSTYPDEIDFTPLWNPFIRQVLSAVSRNGEGMFIFLGAMAKKNEEYVDQRSKRIYLPHPAFCARTSSALELDFQEIDKYLISLYGTRIEWENPFYKVKDKKPF